MASLIELILIGASIVSTNLMFKGIQIPSSPDGVLVLTIIAFAIYKLIYTPLNLILKPIHEASRGLTKITLILLLSSCFMYIGSKITNTIIFTSSKDFIVSIFIFPILMALFFAFGYYDTYDNR